MKNKNKEYYTALVKKDPDYEGVFFAGISSTGIFCRPTCSARKPKFESCEFFSNAQDALLVGYRPCKKCKPLSHPGEASRVVKILIDAVEHNPEKRWRDEDFKKLGVDESTVRRQFKKRFGMTFVAYARARRMGIALKKIRDGESIINTQIDTGYESESGFRDAFSSIMGETPSKKVNAILRAEWVDTPLGPMVVIVDNEGVYLLEFADRRGLEREIEKMRKTLKVAIIPGRTEITDKIEMELRGYFSGKLMEFSTPIVCIGTVFQKSVWKLLRTIPYGQTWSYSDLAERIGNEQACRAVARANGTNQIALVVPCHRVINKNCELGGYAGGVVRKKWLLDHEKRFSK